MLERMHAVVQQAFGGPEVLEVAEADRPVPLATEVLVRVKAVGVNPVEPLIRSGQFPLIGQPLIVPAAGRRRRLAERRIAGLRAVQVGSSAAARLSDSHRLKSAVLQLR